MIGPLLMAELLERKYSACCMVVGSDESIITTNNTLNTLKTLESIAKRVQLPVVMFYEHNERERRRTEVDQQMRLVLSTLGVLCSKQNREMDTKDISNWIQFNKTTTVLPQLAQLEVFSTADDADTVKDPISIASIYGHEDIPPIRAVPEYHAAGYLKMPYAEFEQFHYVISIDAIPTVFSKVKETLDQYHNHRNSRIKQASILTEADEVTEDGLIL